MDWLNVIITAIATLLGAVGGGSVLYVRQNRREKDVANELREADEWEKLYREKEQKCDAKDAKIDELRRHINTLQEERIKSMTEHAATVQGLHGDIAHLRTEMVECNWYRCEVCGCVKRRPPRELDCGIDEK